MMKKLLFILLIFPILSLNSCLKDDKDYFDQNSNERMDEILQDYKDILTSAPNGWVLECYPHPNKIYGGYLYILSFDDDENVDAEFELIREGVLSSSYKLHHSKGPTITFDTYNKYLHYFSEGTSSMYQGYLGDFEFTIVSYEDGVMTLMGNRTNNIMSMRLLEEGVDWDYYLNQIERIQTDVYFGNFDIIIQETKVGSAVRNGRVITFNYTRTAWGEQPNTTVEEPITKEVPFTYTTTGIKLYEPILIKGSEAQYFDWDAETELLVSRDTENDIILSGFITEGYALFDEYLGEWTIHGSGAGNGVLVNVTSEIRNQQVRFSSEEMPYDWLVDYDSSLGVLSLTYQEVGTYGAYTVMLAPVTARGGGRISFGDGVGNNLYLVKDTQPYNIRFVDNGVWQLYQIDSWTLFCFDEGNPVAEYSTLGGDGASFFGYIYMEKGDTRLSTGDE